MKPGVYYSPVSENYVVYGYRITNLPDPFEVTEPAKFIEAGGAFNESAPRAVALAALKALGVEV